MAIDGAKQSSARSWAGVFDFINFGKSATYALVFDENQIYLLKRLN
jgi:hypothetical protein